MDRKRIMERIGVATARGVEIGALDKPVVTRAMGPVEYIDRATRAELQAGYGTDPSVNAEAIVEVDHVWGAQSLFDCVGGRRVYDYVVTSHVIEHVPDLYGWLREIASILVDGGLGVFMTPDKRYTFDIQRRTSGGAEFVEAFVRGQRQPGVRQIFDALNYFRDPQTGADRHGRAPTDARATQEARELVEICQRAYASGEYIDVHCWVFTPRSMIEALDLASRLNLLDFEIGSLELPTGPDNEFALILRRLPQDMGPDERRAAFLASVKALNLPEEIDVEDQRRDFVVASAQAAVARAAAIEASTSWRITAPLRAAVTFLRSLRGPATSS